MNIDPSATQIRESRVALGDVLVALSTDSPGEAFEADVLNVGPGGLAVRSPLLPDVGSRLECTFASPFDGSDISAVCEVVWAADQGPHLGEFGLRFESLSGESAESLRRLVESTDRLLSDDEASELGWSTAPAQPSSIIGLSLDSVASELVAEVVHDSLDALLAEQELPFLRLGTGVTTESGRRGVLQSVELRIEDDLPRLVLTIVYDEEGSLELNQRVESREASYSGASDENDDIEDEDEQAHSSADDADDVDDMPSQARFAHGRSSDDTEFTSEPADAESDHDTIPDDRAAHLDRAAHADRAPAAPASAALREASEPEATKGDAPLSRAADAALAVKDAAAERLSSALPAVRGGIDRARQSVADVAGEVGANAAQTARESLSRMSRFVSLLGAKLRAEESPNEARPRRVQRRPDERTQESSAGTIAAPTRIKGRHILVATLAVVVLGLAAHGVWNAPDAGAAQTQTPATQPVSEPVEALPTSQPSSAAPAQLPDVVPSVPTVTTPEYAAGRIPEPTYPSSVGPEAAAGAARGSASATAQPAPSPGARTFGAEAVPSAMPFELMMHMPIVGISGEATSDGFTVQITGSTSATRAGPIAERHPDVDQASVTNVGENSVLRIRFKPGRRPAYRVEANGNRLRILLGS